VSRGAPAATASRGGPIRGERKFFYVLNQQEEGPLSARNLALLALSKNISLQDLMIRAEDDEPANTYAAEFEPSIRDEYNRRKPS